MEGRDLSVRLAAFEFLDGLNELYGEELPWQAIAKEFTWRGRGVPLLGPQGIFKPAVLPDMPISITTAPPVEGKPRPYEDEFLGADLIVYKYRGRDPYHRDNVGLRMAYERRVPLIYFFGLAKGWYLAARPAYVVGDDPDSLSVTVQVDVATSVCQEPFLVRDARSDGRRAYYTSVVQQRVHQRGFRKRVLLAYKERCAVCRLRHSELLDAAHIIPDSKPHGHPVVPNGLSLCKLHHAAFDKNFLGIRPDLEVEIRRDLLDEEDGPMLVHGIQEFAGSRIRVPRSARYRPDPERLEERYVEFRQTA